MRAEWRTRLREQGWRTPCAGAARCGRAGRGARRGAARLPLARMGIADIRTCRRIEFDRCVTPVQVDGDHMPECAFAIAPSGLTLSYVV